MISVSNWIETSYLYDNNSSRTQKQTSYSGSTNLTKYLNNDFEIENQETLDWSWNILTQTKTNKYIYLWNNKIFTVENKDNTESLVYNISDHLWWWSIDINQTWTILQKSDYYPYGSSRILERNDSYKNNYLFTWKELDSETDLQYFEVRYYNPNFWRFYSQDRVFWELWNTKRWIWVLQDPQQLNSYSYARNNPIIYVDPSGEIAIDIWTWTPIETAVKAYALAVVTIWTYLWEAVSDHIIDNIIEYNSSKKEEKVGNTKIQSSSVSAWWSPWGGGKKPDDRWKTRNEYTNKDYDRIAKEKGLQKTNYLSSWKPVYKWPNWKYYSPEKTAHNTDFWWKEWIFKNDKFIYKKTLDSNFKTVKIK